MDRPGDPKERPIADARLLNNTRSYRSPRFGTEGELIHQYLSRKKGVPRSEVMIEQIVLPKIMRQEALEAYHDCRAGHKGFHRTYAALQQKYYWSASIQLSEAKSTHKQILKLNYGIIFEKQGRIHFGEDVWKHTFQIKMTIKKGSVEIQQCKQKQICRRYNEMIVQLDMLQKQNVVNLNETVNVIKQLIPTNKPTLVKSKRKSKRAILSFVRQLSKTLFNTATMDDVNLLARHINALTTRTLTNTMAQHDQHESSYMASVDKRISNLVTQISDNHNEINMMQKSVLDNVTDAENLFLHLQAKIIESFSLSSKINQQLEQLKLGILI
ncbi:unnamed protein product [Mytilus coruscus]|uniref:Integrase zinc-binding domain-containing protein n=1 Tax=Mytilus coruscus TaxID=42192 RepID=A0A6J8CAQ3_MYTCO|nr:unnamed protein product [Mytilus coruscus]